MAQAQRERTGIDPVSSKRQTTTPMPWLAGLPVPTGDVLLQRGDPADAAPFECTRSDEELFGAGTVGGTVPGVRSRDVELLASILADSLSESGTRQWLTTRNDFLDDRRPITALRSGDVGAVFAAAEALVAGYYG